MLEVEEQLLPRSCALAHAVGEADQLLLALRCGANNDQQALRIVFQPGLNMNAVDPEIDVAFGREVALAPARVLFRPSLLETPYGRGRKPAGSKPVKGTPESGKIRLVKSRKIAKEKNENSDAMRTFLDDHDKPTLAFSYRPHLTLETVGEKFGASREPTDRSVPLPPAR